MAPEKAPTTIWLAALLELVGDGVPVTEPVAEAVTVAEATPEG